jgi:hypothetical protein
MDAGEFVTAHFYQFITALALKDIHLLDDPSFSDEDRAAHQLAYDWGSVLVSHSFLQNHPGNPVAHWVSRQRSAAPPPVLRAFFGLISQDVAQFITKYSPNDNPPNAE